MDNENDLKKPLHVLICFSKPETGKALGVLANDLVRARGEKPAITVLHLIDEAQAREIDDENRYKSQLFTDILEECERNKVTVRTFMKTSDNFVDDILKTSEEQGCNLILLGIGNHVFNAELWDKYRQLKKDPQNSETDIYGKFAPNEARSIKNVSSLLARNNTASGVFINNNFVSARRIFVPLLDKEDAHILTYIYQTALKDNVYVTVWDAIGITVSNPKVQKIFQYITKRTDDRVKLWNNNKKIELEFIARQDLVIIGTEGWEKLIGSALTWTPSLPSTLIIKDKTA